jgi:hypothetical protein
MQVCFYCQADQILWREPSFQVCCDKGRGREDPQGFSISKPKLSHQRAAWFSFFNFAPSYHNAMPFSTSTRP